MRRSIPLLLLAILVSACGGDSPDPTSAVSSTTEPEVGPGTTAVIEIDRSAPPDADRPLVGLDGETVARTLENPVFLTALPGDDRLFVLEKAGRIRIITADGLTAEPFLDLTDRVEADALEQGLLGLAFHPDYEDNGRFFVYYTGESGESNLVEYRVSGDPDRADADSAVTLIVQAQPESNHNAGMLEFGPDGYLWVSLGDGGGAGDPGDNAQNPNTLLGTILRLDVDSTSPYAVPPDNPFLDGSGQRQVWAYGLRNPWRFAIDAVDGLIYIADVGQDQWEEIDVVALDGSGYNFGWSVVEGPECYKADECDLTDKVAPVHAYTHAEGCSVIGGFVYRGTAIPELWGHYFYGDWCGRWVRSFRFENGETTDHRDWTADLGQLGQVQSFGQGGHGELYVLTADGFVVRIVPRR